MLKQEIKRILSNRNLYFYITYWILYLLFFTTQRFFALQTEAFRMGFSDPKKIDLLKESFLTNLAFLPLVIIATHFVVNIILPKYFFRNKFYIFSILLGVLVFVYPILVYFLRKIVVEPIVLHRPMDYSWYNYFMAMLIFVFGMVPLAWYKISSHLREDALLRQKIDNDRLNALLKLKETELKLLKSQIHPHFLFNTLNNLYSLSLEKSDKTPDLIIKLADMLSYIIYDCNSEKVPLAKEIDFINSFMELQRVRYDSCDISLNIKGDINNKQIAPMILHTFVDNSFKHGADKDSGNPWIKVSITFKDGLLYLLVLNSTIKKGEENDKKVPGIGISNAKKRLELIYKGRYELIINNSANRYSAFLKLQL